MIEFLDDDEGYLSWIATNPDGLVLNVRRMADPNYVVLHRANCGSISTDKREPGAYTRGSDESISKIRSTAVHEWSNASSGAGPQR